MARLRPEKISTPTYRQIWRVVDGAVASAFAAHPDYVASGKKLSTVRNSITKRVTGAIAGYAEQSAWVRSGSIPADEMVCETAKLSETRGALGSAPTIAALTDCRAAGTTLLCLPLTEDGSVDLTAVAIGFLGAITTFGGPALIVWCLRLNGFV